MKERMQNRERRAVLVLFLLVEIVLVSWPQLEMIEAVGVYITLENYEVSIHSFPERFKKKSLFIKKLFIYFWLC